MVTRRMARVRWVGMMTDLVGLGDLVGLEE